MKRISDKKDVVLDKGIYVNVLETNANRRELFLVYNKKGIPLYEIKAEGIVEIDQDIKLLPNVDAEISYPAHAKLAADDKVVFLNTHFNLHFDNLQTTPFNTIYNVDLTSVLGTRYEVRTLYVSRLPVNFGFGINFQNASWSNEFDQIKLSIMSLGPQIEKQFYADDNMIVSVLAGAEFAPIYRTSSGDSVEKYKAMLFDLGAEATWETRFGKWSLGGHYRRHDLTLTESSRAGLNPVPEELIINSIGAMVGYKYEWNL